ncbi:hypothetical protein ACQZV8_05290 [Magnetococcales bacterium HHB-1]
MPSSLRPFLFKVFRMLAALGIMPRLAQHIVSQSEIIGSEKKIHPDKPTILALTGTRFRGDLVRLASHFNVILFPEYWQTRLHDLYTVGLSDVTQGEQARHSFFIKVLRRYHRRQPFDLVLGTCLWYRQDISWGRAAEAMGIPYVIMHKECLKTEPNQLAMVVQRVRNREGGIFQGSHVIVHNAVIAETLIQAEYLPPEKISPLGCMRMDDFVKKLNESRLEQKAVDKRATLFSFNTGMGLDDLAQPWPKNPYLGWIRLFERAHAEFARMALAFPDVEFIIKLKWGGDWWRHVHSALEANGLDVARIDNLTITDSHDAQDLIFHSDLICCFSSTTMLEAGIAGKTVIIPCFEEAQRSGYAERVKLHDMFHLFHSATTVDQYKQFIRDALERPTPISDTCMKERRALFEKWIASLDQQNTSRYVAKLNAVIGRDDHFVK